MRKKTIEEFIEDARKVHGGRYNYSVVEYVRDNVKVVITCPEHGNFLQVPSSHLQGNGCPKCGILEGRLSKTKNILCRKYNGLVQPDDYKLIPLTKGKFAKVDNEDFEYLSQFNWYCANGYAYNKELGRMHRFVMNAPDDLEVDHVEPENILDNRKSNLRLATRPQNCANQRPREGSSQYKGVYWFKKRNEWRAQIMFKGKCYNLGGFEDEIEAVKVRDLKALELQGEFAYLNFPELKEQYLKQIKEENG